MAINGKRFLVPIWWTRNWGYAGSAGRACLWGSTDQAVALPRSRERSGETSRVPDPVRGRSMGVYAQGRALSGTEVSTSSSIGVCTSTGTPASGAVKAKSTLSVWPGEMFTRTAVDGCRSAMTSTDGRRPSSPVAPPNADPGGAATVTVVPMSPTPVPHSELRGVRLSRQGEGAVLGADLGEHAGDPLPRAQLCGFWNITRIVRGPSAPAKPGTTAAARASPSTAGASVSRPAPGGSSGEPSTPQRSTRRTDFTSSTPPAEPRNTSRARLAASDRSDAPSAS